MRINIIQYMIIKIIINIMIINLKGVTINLQMIVKLLCKMDWSLYQ
jgi:hypothetical protein